MDWQLALERVSGDSDLVDGQNSTDGLAQHARNVANQIQTLVAHQIPEEDSLITLGDNTSYTELIRRLSIAFERQQAVNEATGRMTATNYVVNVANYIRNRQLIGQVQKSQKKIGTMESHIELLESTVSLLNTDVSVQKTISDRFKSNLDSTRKLLETTIVNYREEMARQVKALQEQQELLDSIKKRAISQAFAIDSALLLIASYLTSTPLINYPVILISRFFVQLTNSLPFFRGVSSSKISKNSRRRRLATTMLFRLILIYWMLNWGRQTLEGYGIYKGVGGWLQYFRHIITATDSKQHSEHSPATASIPPA